MEATNEKAIFLEAIEIENADERAAFVENQCAHAPGIQSAVQALLAAHEEPDNPLDQPLATPRANPGDEQADTMVAPRPTKSDAVGIMIDRYKLMEQIGEGGFGLVFVARQAEPVRRDVALKIIKPGSGNKDVIARFEAERQALAMMDHPNIARVFDAGVYRDETRGPLSPLGSDRPYFVMELVRGVPITEYCDAEKMTVPKRLELFSAVCAAVQHAHQKGVIHRDLKPSNVLVTVHDGEPVAKVIDFGVAKAIGTQLTDSTIYTRFHSMIGTPLYMSPEQAEMTGSDTDTRSDIYSLGVLLYELLAGITPFDRHRMSTAGFDELRRIIRDEEPPRPSDRLKGLGDDLNRVAKARGEDANQLPSRLEGDLDWIVLKAMDKNRNRRYESAAAFAADLRNHLHDKPVIARPPSRLYLIQKFTRRNRAAIVTSGLVATALIAGLTGSLWQMSVAIGERNDKDAALQQAIAAEAEARDAKQEVERFAESLKDATQLIARAYTDTENEDFGDALEKMDRAVALQPNYYLTHLQRAQLHLRLNLWNHAADDFATAVEMGAPANGPGGESLPALFLLNGNHAAYQSALDALWATIPEGGIASWNILRSALIATNPGRDPGLLLDQSTRAFERDRQSAADWPSFADAMRFLGAPDNRRPPDDRRRERVEPRDFFGPGPPRGRPQNGPGPPLGNEGGPINGNAPGFGGNRDRSFRAPIGVQRYVLGLAAYRNGEFDSALEHWQAALEDRGWRGTQLLKPLQASLYHQQGDHEAANAALQASASSVDELLSRLQSPTSEETTARFRGPWIDQVDLLLLHREALQLVKGSSATLDRQLAEAQASARERLGF
ncbi:MAG: protein kinase [Planctomycetota bacterium]